MSRTLRIFGRAKADASRILTWLKNCSEQGAGNWLQALVDAIGRIGRAPDEYGAAAESSARWRRDVRQAFFKTRRGRRYRILFDLTETEVRILRVRGPGQPPLRSRDIPSG